LVACSNEYAILISVGSFHARPKNEMPIGRPNTTRPDSDIRVTGDRCRARAPSEEVIAVDEVRHPCGAVCRRGKRVEFVLAHDRIDPLRS